jgi:hypothetical protein
MCTNMCGVALLCLYIYLFLFNRVMMFLKLSGALTFKNRASYI